MSSHEMDCTFRLNPRTSHHTALYRSGLDTNIIRLSHIHTLDQGRLEC